MTEGDIYMEILRIVSKSYIEKTLLIYQIKFEVDGKGQAEEQGLQKRKVFFCSLCPDQGRLLSRINGNIHKIPLHGLSK